MTTQLPPVTPTTSPLHPPSVAHNTRILSSLSTLSACASGLVAGILGLTNLPGFFLYLVTAILSAVTVSILKCQGDIPKYVPQAHAGQTWKGWLGLIGLGQENLLGFLLFWIGSFALIHVYD